MGASCRKHHAHEMHPMAQRLPGEGHQGDRAPKGPVRAGKVLLLSEVQGGKAHWVSCLSVTVIPQRTQHLTSPLSLSKTPSSWIHVKLHEKDTCPMDDLKRWCIYQMETGRELLTLPNEKITLVFDMTGFSMKNMVSWSLSSLGVLYCL